MNQDTSLEIVSKVGQQQVPEWCIDQKFSQSAPVLLITKPFFDIIFSKEL